MDEVRGNNDSDIVDVMTRSHLIKFNYTYLILVSNGVYNKNFLS